jgi:hypothetical protein
LRVILDGPRLGEHPRLAQYPSSAEIARDTNSVTIAAGLLRGEAVPITVTMEVPEELAAAVTSGGRDLPRAALEALAVEAYRSRRLTDSQFRRLLGLNRWEADGVLKAHGVWLDYTADDFKREGEAIRNVRERLRK